MLFFLGGRGGMGGNQYKINKKKSIEIFRCVHPQFWWVSSCPICRRFLLPPFRQGSKTFQPPSEVGIGLEHVAARWNLVELQEVSRRVGIERNIRRFLFIAAKPKLLCHFSWSGDTSMVFRSHWYLSMPGCLKMSRSHSASESF